MNTVSLQEKFEEYDKANPSIYEMFKKFSFEAIKAGRKILSANQIFERIRWETTVSAVGDSYKVNNNYRAFYARKFMNEFPAESQFNTRRQLAA